MKPFALATAALGLLWPMVAATVAEQSSPQPSSSSSIVAPTDFQPPQVFKNENLVHLINLEHNYAKETVNVVIENVSQEPQDQYYVPFTADQMERVGGFEVKDRKNPAAGTFGVGPVEFDPNSDTQYYRITLPVALSAGERQTLSISYYFLKAYSPLPAAINQDDDQFLQYEFSAYWPSAYVTDKQKTEVKAASANVPDYTKVPADDSGKSAGPLVQGAKLTYGPFADKPAGAVLPASVRFEFTKPVTHVAVLERDVEVSHWGGNVAFEERYELLNRGANLSVLFDRAKWARSQYLKPVTYALKEMRFPLRAGSVDAYYTDVIGNVSTSRFRANKRESVLEAKPRYPVFGGWKYPFTIGWNSDAKNYVRNTPDGGFVLNVPFLEGPQSKEGAEYETVQLRIILPEGAE
jgi:oligosaccharyltransferase complex subunit alpha (ribophorin I)